MAVKLPFCLIRLYSFPDKEAIFTQLGKNHHHPVIDGGRGNHIDHLL